MGKRIIFEGDKFNLNCGSIATVVCYKNNRNIEIKTNTGYSIKCASAELRLGNVKDLFARTYHNIGFIGIGIYNSNSKCYEYWRGMIKRCYSDSYMIRFPTYKDKFVCTEWHNLQVFGKWFDKNYIDSYYLDKDLKNPGAKIYSPENCMFVASEINTMFSTGANNNLPHGVMTSYKGFRDAINRTTVKTIIEAKNNYWNEKYNKTKESIIKYPKLKIILLNYFEYFFSEYYE